MFTIGEWYGHWVSRVLSRNNPPLISTSIHILGTTCSCQLLQPAPPLIQRLLMASGDLCSAGNSITATAPALPPYPPGSYNSSAPDITPAPTAPHPDQRLPPSAGTTHNQRRLLLQRRRIIHLKPDPLPDLRRHISAAAAAGLSLRLHHPPGPPAPPILRRLSARRLNSAPACRCFDGWNGVMHWVHRRIRRNPPAYNSPAPAPAAGLYHHLISASSMASGTA
ncbi:hypothetical protein NPIL_472801 [Nephila pilipes]|uniref:Uncharacterized protein n=1 Tax=Nephila pilipes TaxID=299642 RepID=A0A8X6R3H8_NEPPI|nr:hypothetical protein NPIL_472801 [Nephila pilipes]